MIYSVSAVSLSPIDSATLNHATGTGGTVFDNTGNNLYAFGSWYGSNPNLISRYILGIAYNLSTLTYYSTYNLTAFYPAQYQNYTLSAGYITPDGDNMYFVLINDTTTNVFKKFFIGHIALTNFNLDTMVYSDGVNTSQIYGGAYAPDYRGIFVTPDYNYLFLGGAYYLGGVSGPRIDTYNLSGSSNISLNSKLANLPYLTNSSAFISSSYDDSAFFSPDYSFYALVQKSISSGQIYFYVGSVSNGLQQGMPSPLGASLSGLTIVSTFNNLYAFVSQTGTYTRYQVNNLTVQANQAINQNVSVGATIINIFPDAQTISFGQKMLIMVLTIVITMVLLLVAGSSHVENKVLLWLVAVIVFAELAFFIGIGYIPLGFIISVVVVGLIIGYFMLRHRS